MGTWSSCGIISVVFSIENNDMTFFSWNLHKIQDLSCHMVKYSEIDIMKNAKSSKYLFTEALHFFLKVLENIWFKFRCDQNYIMPLFFSHNALK